MVTTKEIKQAIRQPYALPGGYPLFFLMDDSDVLCKDCARDEWPNLCEATRDNIHNGWLVMGISINWEDTDLYCCNCNTTIESAY